MAQQKTATIQQQIGKHFQLSKAQKAILIAAGIGIFVIVFTVVAAKALISQKKFQSTVISSKQTALNQLKTNEKTVAQLNQSYLEFVSAPKNALDGNPTGNGPKDGSNAVLVLDALPDYYDFPALTSSLEKVIIGQNMTIKGISGQDDQVTQQTNTSSTDPKPTAIPFSISADGSIDQVESLIGQFEHSIRPFQIQTLDLKGDQDNMTVSMTAQTYFQPAKNFNITKAAASNPTKEAAK
ncbi:MAG: hypothetical protein ABI220_04975 [Candidatus Saccharimonadales bacterium]